MKNYNLITTPIELGVKLSKLEGGEAVDSNTYRNMIGSLRYLTCSGGRKPIHGSPRYPYLKVVKIILRYVKGT